MGNMLIKRSMTSGRRCYEYEYSQQDCNVNKTYIGTSPPSRSTEQHHRKPVPRSKAAPARTTLPPAGCAVVERWRQLSSFSFTALLRRALN